jgi:putative Mg2+ transporter-C (MgtC) family protein
MYDWYSIFSDFGKILLAAILGGSIGFEREAHGQAAGFRTYLIVSTGACLMMLLSLHIEELYHDFHVSESVVRLDPGRIASYAIASMGFLGAGAIIKGKGTVRGLTTAAGLWAVTGIGLSVGAGYIYPTLFTSFIILVSLYWVDPIRALAHRRIFSMLTIKFKGEKDPLEQIRKIILNYPSYSIRSINYHHEIISSAVTYNIRLSSNEEKYWTQIVNQISEINGVEAIKWDESDVP